MRYVLGGIGILGLFVALVWGGLWLSRWTNPFAEDTRRKTFEHSRAHISGTNSAISDYCLNMRTATDPAQKKALARWIINEASTFEGNLTSDSQECLSEAQTQL